MIIQWIIYVAECWQLRRDTVAIIPTTKPSFCCRYVDNGVSTWCMKEAQKSFRAFCYSLIKGNKMPFRITYSILSHPLRNEFVEERDGMVALEIFMSQVRTVYMDIGDGWRKYRLPTINSLPDYTEWTNIRVGERICNLYWNRFDGATTCQELHRAKVVTMKCLYYMDVHRDYAILASDYE